MIDANEIQSTVDIAKHTLADLFELYCSLEEPKIKAFKDRKQAARYLLTALADRATVAKDAAEDVAKDAAEDVAKDVAEDVAKDVAEAPTPKRTRNHKRGGLTYPQHLRKHFAAGDESTLDELCDLLNCSAATLYVTIAQLKKAENPLIIIKNKETKKYYKR